MNAVSATVDTTEFDETFKKYMSLTSKSFKDAVNNKLFDIARFSYRDTGKADRNTIKSALQQISNKYPDRTVAQMIVIMAAHDKGQEVKDLDNEAQKLVKSRVGHAGYVKSGWIQAMKEIAPLLGKSGFNVSRPSTLLAPGGGKPVVRESSVAGGSVFNDASGKRNAGLVETLKEDGAQSAVDKVNADMENYIAKKLAKIAKESGF